MALKALIRGGGDLSSGVAYRLIHAGWQVLATELPEPLAVRRLVSFSQAVYDRCIRIEDVEGVLSEDLDEAFEIIRSGKVAVIVDPENKKGVEYQPHVLIDGRMMKKASENNIHLATLVIGLGPGFTAGENCHAVIETMRGPYMGRVYWTGMAQDDTGQPDPIGPQREDRVLRSPCDGVFIARTEIGSLVKEGELIAEVSGAQIRAKFDGVLRGLMQPGRQVWKGLKVGDVDPRLDPALSNHISDKSLAIGGAVLEAILSVKELRPILWDI